jgi:hypothetical protein
MLAWPVDPSVGGVAQIADAAAAVDVAAALVVHSHTEVVVEGAGFDAVDAEDVADIDAVAVVVALAADVDTNTYFHYYQGDCWLAEECYTRSCILLP